MDRTSNKSIGFLFCREPHIHQISQTYVGSLWHGFNFSFLRLLQRVLPNNHIENGSSHKVRAIFILMKRNKRSVVSLDPLHKFDSNYTKKTIIKDVLSKCFPRRLQLHRKSCSTRETKPEVFLGGDSPRESLLIQTTKLRTNSVGVQTKITSPFTHWSWKLKTPGSSLLLI
jgi:hypothetical protein